MDDPKQWRAEPGGKRCGGRIESCRLDTDETKSRQTVRTSLPLSPSQCIRVTTHGTSIRCSPAALPLRHRRLARVPLSAASAAPATDSASADPRPARPPGCGRPRAPTAAPCRPRRGSQPTPRWPPATRSATRSATPTSSPARSHPAGFAPRRPRCARAAVPAAKSAQSPLLSRSPPLFLSFSLSLSMSAPDSPGAPREPRAASRLEHMRARAHTHTDKEMVWFKVFRAEREEG